MSKLSSRSLKHRRGACGRVAFRACLLLAAVAAPLAAAGGAASDTDSQPGDAAVLLRRFEPVLYFHRLEDWAPEAADGFVGRARVEKQIGSGLWALAPPPLPTSASGCSFAPCYRFNLPCALRSGDGCYQQTVPTISDWAQPLVYGRLLPVPAGTPPSPGTTIAPRYLLRYWLFYEFDDWRSPHERLWQTHEGDWESITIGLSETLQPLFAAYSEHCSGTIRPWSSVSTRAGSHPVAYVALGSHALYFSNATVATDLLTCLRKYLTQPRFQAAARIVRLAADRLVDRMGTARIAGPAGMAGVAPLQLIELTDPLPAWARFPGRWSEGQLLWLGRRPSRLTSVYQTGGPATPNWNGTSLPSYWHSLSS